MAILIGKQMIECNIHNLNLNLNLNHKVKDKDKVVKLEALIVKIVKVSIMMLLILPGILAIINKSLSILMIWA